ncbi:MAG: tyrosine--tRNA ligase [Chloroflexi bacterium]|nr:tyrosine--tRNA ligase [Chloroflexota bacterium]
MAAPELKGLLKRAVAETIVESELIKLLESGKPLRLKQGFDPSCPDIHLGHVVGLRKLRQFQQLGHRVVLIVGDWTARIGDPSGVSATRPMLSAEEVRANAETYMKQFFKVVDKDKTEVRWQSEWFGKFGLEDVIKLTGKFTVAQFLAREDFSKRYNTGQPIAITELLYPLLQAYDSVAIEADVEFGGTDQKFNCLAGRELQQMMGQRSQQVFLVPLLIGTDGSQKMSKSLGNYIGVDEPANEIYGKAMSIPDSLIVDYLELMTDVPDEEITEFKVKMANQSVNPMVVKKRLAYEIVAQFHGVQAAQDAEKHFATVFQKHKPPTQILGPSGISSEEAVGTPTVAPVATVGLSGTLFSSGALTAVHVVTVGLSGVLTAELTKARLTQSRSEARRLLAQGAIDIDGKTVTEDIDVATIRSGSIIKVGKRRFAKIVKEGDQLDT